MQKTRHRLMASLLMFVSQLGSLAYIKSKFHHIAWLHDIGFAFGADLAGFARFGFGACCHEVIIIHHLRRNEASLEVGVDDSGGLGCRPALVDRPGVHFLGARGEVALQAERIVRCPDQLCQASLGHIIACQELQRILRVEPLELIL